MKTLPISHCFGLATVLCVLLSAGGSQSSLSTGDASCIDCAQRGSPHNFPADARIFKASG